MPPEFEKRLRRGRIRDEVSCRASWRSESSFVLRDVQDAAIEAS